MTSSPRPARIGPHRFWNTIEVGKWTQERRLGVGFERGRDSEDECGEGVRLVRTVSWVSLSLSR